MQTEQLTTKYGPFEVIKGDHISNIMKDGYYEDEYINIVLNNAHKNRRNALDIGANVGTWTVPLSINFEKVFSFEPQPAVFEVLKRNASKENIQLNNCAVGHVSGSTCMQLDRATDNTGGLAISNIGDAIEMKKIDDLPIQNIDFIKIDVEGAEKLVIYGGRNTIKRDRPLLFFEHTNTSKFMAKNFIHETELTEFNIFEFLLCDCGYSKLIRFKSNFLVIP